MPLPLIQQPIFEVFLKSVGNVKFRPFLVKEEKILLIAKESDDQNASINAIKQVLNNCMIPDSAGAVPDVNSMPLFDIQMLYIHLRMKSIGETVALEFTCANNVDGNECGQTNAYNLDLNKVRYDVLPGHNNIVQITDQIGVKLRYPTLASNIAESEDILDDSIKLIAEHMDYVFDADGIYDNFTKADVEEFVSSLSSDQLDRILNFFTTSPKVVLDDTAVCKKCSNPHRIYAEDLYSFFI